MATERGQAKAAARQPAANAEPARFATPASVTPAVNLDTASLCPFCPIVRERLKQLQSELGFELNEIDVTLRPGLLQAKGIRGVPVIEAEGRSLHGNATTAELREL